MRWFQRGEAIRPVLFLVMIFPLLHVPDPWLRKTFSLDARPEHAAMYVASVGYHELYVNGQRVGDAVLSPAVVNHRRRPTARQSQRRQARKPRRRPPKDPPTAPRLHLPDKLGGVGQVVTDCRIGRQGRNEDANAEACRGNDTRDRTNLMLGGYYGCEGIEQ